MKSFTGGSSSHVQFFKPPIAAESSRSTILLFFTSWFNLRLPVQFRLKWDYLFNHSYFKICGKDEDECSFYQAVSRKPATVSPHPSHTVPPATYKGVLLPHSHIAYAFPSSPPTAIPPDYYSQQDKRLLTPLLLSSSFVSPSVPPLTRNLSPLSSQSLAPVRFPILLIEVIEHQDLFKLYTDYICTRNCSFQKSFPTCDRKEKDWLVIFLVNEKGNICKEFQITYRDGPLHL